MLKNLVISVNKSPVSKIDSVNFDALSFGSVFSDHMFVCDYKDGQWKDPEIIPYQPITLEPSARVFHYGQAIFEGMKAFKDEQNQLFLFRPEDNFKRFNRSAKRLAMPEVPQEIFMEGLDHLVRLEEKWVKCGIGRSLYLRPFMIATDAAISAAPSKNYKFLIIASPAGVYYSSEVRVIIAEKYSRAADGGIGFTKAAGNYAAQFYPTSLAHQKGYQQVIWTDSNSHEYVEEAGTMNVFFRIRDTLLTAPTSDHILDGITRKSVLQLAEDMGIPTEVRRISVKEIKDAARSGELKEIFGSGTAAVINPICGFEHAQEYFELKMSDNSYATILKNRLTAIQHNCADDPHQWRHLVP